MPDSSCHPVIPSSGYPAARLRERIAAQGSLTIAEYMEAALLDPEYGYYTTGTPFGMEGDFITAPDISQIFGELIGIYLADAWQKLGSPHAALVEIGPGRGTLMADLLRATRNIPGFHERVAVHLVEASPKLMEVQQSKLQADISWHTDITALPPLPLLLIANEWLDALPIRQFISTREGFKERLVGWDAQTGFRFELSPTLAYPDTAPQSEGSIMEICQSARDAVRHVARHLKRYGGTALFIDYGYLMGNGDTLQAVKSHRYQDPLLDPGTADITAHVDFGTLLGIARAEGISTELTPQGTWLKQLGAEIRAMQLCKNADAAQKADILSGLERLISPTQMGDLFKVMQLYS